MKYINADKIRNAIESEADNWGDTYTDCMRDNLLTILDYLQQEQPDFPTTDEEIEMFLATHPKVELSNKYKTPDWLWKKQKQPDVDLEKEIDNYLSNSEDIEECADNEHYYVTKSALLSMARYFFIHGRLNARVEE